MKYYYLNRKPFNEKVKPFYPGNVPYLSQFKYARSVKHRIKPIVKAIDKYNLGYEKYSKPYVRNTLSFFYEELNSLSYILEKFFNCPIKLELNRIKLPYSDSNIMAQLIGINGEEDDFDRIKNKFIYNFKYRNPNKSEFKLKSYDGFKPFFIKDINSNFTLPSGYKVRVAGRFYKHKIIPRKTVTSMQNGSLARGVVNLVEKARYVNKSKRGSFSITV